MLITAISYSITVATLPEPTVLPPSRSDLVISRNLYVTVFAVLWLILWVFYLLFLLFPEESIKNVSRFFVHLSHNIAWSKNNVNEQFLQNFGYDTYFANRDTRFYVSQRTVVFAFGASTVIHIQVKAYTKDNRVYLYSYHSHFLHAWTCM